MAFTEVKSLGLGQDRKLTGQKGIESRAVLGAPAQRTFRILCVLRFLSLLLICTALSGFGFMSYMAATNAVFLLFGRG